MQRTDWDQLSRLTREAIEAHTGPVRGAATASAGQNSAIAALLETDAGAVFVKGLRTEHPMAAAQRREVAVSRYVVPLSPELLWHTEADGWTLLGYQAATGRHADYAPGSPDLPKVVDVMRRLEQIWCPALPQLKRAEKRWAAYLQPADLHLLHGDTLLHTDYAPDNVLIDGADARLIDWAWPTLGAAFIDPCCLIVRLVFAGHTAEQAEACVAPLAAWRNAPSRSLDAFATALTSMWVDIASADPDPWKQQMAAAALSWRNHRQSQATAAELLPG